MGIISFNTANESDPPFADASILDACIDPQFNGVFPDDLQMGIVPERKANVFTDTRTNDNLGCSQDLQSQLDDPCPSRLR